MFGTVTRYYDDKGYGFIRGEDGNTYFIHASNLYGEWIARGYYVHFKTFVTDRSDYNAKNVNVKLFQCFICVTNIRISKQDAITCVDGFINLKVVKYILKTLAEYYTKFFKIKRIT